MTKKIGQLMSGYPRITGPVSDTVIHTDEQGLDCGAAWIPVDDGEIPAYYAKPDYAKPESGDSFPVILFIQEVFGCDDYLQDTCRRAAKEGFFAVAVELYVRQGEPGKAEDRESLFRIVGSVPDEQVMADLDAAAAWAGNQGGDTQRLYCTGFCWGGRMVWLYAAHNPRLKAGVAWYGRLEGDRTERQPAFPIDLVDELKAPVLGLYGEKDQGIPMDSVERMQRSLAADRPDSSIHVYQNAPHAFHADYRPSYVEADALDGWRRMLDWFASR